MKTYLVPTAIFILLTGCTSTEPTTPEKAASAKPTQSWTAESCRDSGGLVIEGDPQRCKIGDDIMPIGATDAVIVGATADEDQFKEDLRNLGLEFIQAWPIEGKVLGEQGLALVLTNSNVVVMAFRYNDASQASSDYELLTAGEPLPDGRTIAWDATAHMYHTGNIVLVYPGTNETAVQELDTIMMVR